MILAILMIILLPCLSYSQNYIMFRTQLEEILERTRLRIGPLRIFPSIEIRDIGYDSNVYQMPTGEINPISDYTVTAGVGLDVNLLYRNWVILSFSEHPQYVYYFNVKNLRALNNSFSSEMRTLILNRFVLSGRYGQSREKRRPSSEFDVPINEEVIGGSGSFFYETSPRTSFGFSWAANTIRYDNVLLPEEGINAADALDRDVKSGNFEFYYKIFSESLFFVRIGYFESNFEDIEAQWRNAYSYEVLSGIEFPLLGRVRGTLSLGYRKLLPREESIERFTGLIGHTSLEFRTGRFIFRLQYNRDFQFSFSSRNAYFIENRYGLGISFYLTSFLRLDSDVLYGINNYPHPFTVIGPGGQLEEIHRRDIIRTYTTGLVFRIFRNIGTGVTFNYFERKPNYWERGRERWLVGGSLTYGF